MYSAGSHISLEPRLHALQDRPPVRAVPEAEDFEKYCLFKRAEYICHKDYIVGIEAGVSSFLFVQVAAIC